MLAEARRLGSLHPKEEDFGSVCYVFRVTLVLVFKQFNILTRFGSWITLEISLYRLGSVGIHTVLKA